MHAPDLGGNPLLRLLKSPHLITTGIHVGCDAEQCAGQSHAGCYDCPHVSAQIAEELLVPFATFLSKTDGLEIALSEVSMAMRISTFVRCQRTLDIDPDCHPLGHKRRHRKGRDWEQKLARKFPR